MEIEKNKGIIEAILFAAGRIVTEDELVLGLELPKEDIHNIIQSMQEDYKSQNRGIEIIKVENGYQMASKTNMYDYIYPVLDKRAKPKLSTAALETLSIIAYNPRITRAEIEAIRGVSADAAIYKLLEFGLIEIAGKLDAPGRPTTYKTSNEFLKMFGYTSLDNLPELPKYKLDENKQIVIEELVEEQEKESTTEAPSPAREQVEKTIVTNEETVENRDEARIKENNNNAEE